MKEIELTCITSARSKTLAFTLQMFYVQIDNAQIGGWNHLEVQKVAVLKNSLPNLIQFQMNFHDIFFCFRNMYHQRMKVTTWLLTISPTLHSFLFDLQ